MKDDVISRQAAIDAIDEYIEEYSFDIDENGYHNPKWCAMQEARMTIQNLPSAQPEKRPEERTETHECDLIDRQAAIKLIERMKPYHQDADDIAEMIANMQSAQLETTPIDYYDCANAILKMWMDNVVTDGEYYRIMDKLDAYWGKKDG